MQIVALYHWHPDYVWEHVGLFDGLDYLREGIRKIALTAQLQGALLLSPLMGEAQRSQLTEFLESLEPPAAPVTLAEKYGDQVAREVADLEARQRAWLQQRGCADGRA